MVQEHADLAPYQKATAKVPVALMMPYGFQRIPYRRLIVQSLAIKPGYPNPVRH